jgi:hypothetical protein
MNESGELGHIEENQYDGKDVKTDNGGKMESPGGFQKICGN